jgi:uncharacterized protein (DUF1330 family)
MGHVDPTKEVFAQFRANDRPGPIHMLNLVRLRAEAAYPDGRKATGAEAYAAYGRESGPVFERLGGRIVWQGSFELMLIGPQEERWDHCFIAEYPSVAAFAEMIRDPVYREAVKHRQAAVEDSRLIRHAVLPVGKTFGEVPRRHSTEHGVVFAFSCPRPRLKQIGGPEGPPIASSADRSRWRTSPPGLRPRGSGRTVPSARR